MIHSKHNKLNMTAMSKVMLIVLLDVVATAACFFFGLWARYDFAFEIFRQAGYNTKVTPVTTAEYGLSKAARPFNSRLDKHKLVENGFEPLPDWRDALCRYLKAL